MKKFRIIPVLLSLGLLLGCTNQNDSSSTNYDPEPVIPPEGEVTPDPTLESIDVTSNPTKAIYEVGDSFSSSGLVVTATYSDKSTSQINDYILSPADGYVFTTADIGTKEFIVTHQGKATSFNVTVNRPQVNPDDYEFIDPISPVKPSEPVKAERVYIASMAISVMIENKYYLSPVVMPNDAIKNIKFIVANPDIAEVDEHNFAIGKSVGSTIIKSYNDDDNDDILDDDEAFAVTAISVIENEDNSSITFDNTEITLTVGESITPTFKLNNFSAAANTLGYYSTNNDVANYANQTLVAYKSGECYIYISKNGMSGIAHVTVNDKLVGGKEVASDIIAQNKLMTLVEGESKEIKYSLHVAHPENAGEVSVTFTSSNPEVAKIENGYVIALEAGSALISASLSGDEKVLETINVDVRKSKTQYEDNYYNNYYGDLTWENGEDLKAKLKAIISKDKKTLTYNNWAINQEGDVNLYDLSYMASIYGDEDILKTSTQTAWQKEHAFCASLMTSTTTSNAINTVGRATDFHNLYAAFASGNGSRGNKCLGNADKTAPDYNDKGTYAYTRQWFEPIASSDKGKVARAIFYMGVMYDDIQKESYSESSTSLSINMPGVNIINDNVDYNSRRISLNKFASTDEEYTELREYYYDFANVSDDAKAYQSYLENSIPYCIGGLNDLISWNSYEVTQEEMRHNEAVYNAQTNRNPFVDYPELVNYVYGELRFTSGSLKDLRPSYLSLEMNKEGVHHYALGENAKKTYKVGESVSPTSLDVKAINYDLSISNVSSDLFTPYVIQSSDTGKKQITFNVGDIEFLVNIKVTSDEEGFIKVSEFDANKTYYLSADGTNFATTTISNKAITMSDNDDNIAAVTFELVPDTSNQYYVTLTKGTTSINLGNSGSSTDITNSKAKWKVNMLTGGGLVLQEAGSDRYLGLMSTGSKSAKAYAKSSLKLDSKYPPVYLYILK